MILRNSGTPHIVLLFLDSRLRGKDGIRAHHMTCHSREGGNPGVFPGLIEMLLFYQIIFLFNCKGWKNAENE